MNLELPGVRRIAVIAPSGKTAAETVEKGLAALRRTGADVQVMPHVGQGTELPFLDSGDAERAADFMAAAECGEVVWAVRGGYGGVRTLELLDWERLRKHPVRLAGFSDVTALHWAMVARNAGEAISAPMFRYLAEMDDELSLSTLAAALRGDPVTLQLPALRPGVARGSALAGNLTVAASLAGTKYFPDTAGKVVCLEDVGEAPYRIDRSLAQLRLAGAFERCAGVVFGNFTDCGEADAVAAVLRDFADKIKSPVFTGLSFGHELPFYSLSSRQMLTVSA